MKNKKGINGVKAVNGIKAVNGTHGNHGLNGHNGQNGHSNGHNGHNGHNGIDAANGAGGKDNITVVYVQGPDFVDRMRNGATLPLTPTPAQVHTPLPVTTRSTPGPASVWRPYLYLVLGVVIGVLATLALGGWSS